MSKKQWRLVYTIVVFVVVIILRWATPSQESILDEIKPLDEASVLVTRVIDGDTIELENGQGVRYIGIDTPETKHPTKGVECFGQEAYAYNRALVLGQFVRLEKDVSETDRYGRLLRYVYLDDLFVNQYLVEGGYAQASLYPPDLLHQEALKSAETVAREQGLGLWGEVCEEEASI